MDLKVRKEELKKLSLVKKSNGPIIYRLICYGSLDNIIEKLNDKKTITNSKCIVKRGYLSGNEQFIDIMSEFIYYFKNKFPATGFENVYLSFILKDKLPKFFLSKKYWGDNRNISYYEPKIRKLLVENIYSNIQFIYSEYYFHTFFKKIGINNKMKLNKQVDVDKLLNFMVELVWYNYDEISLRYIFLDYKIDLREIINGYKGKKDKDIKEIVRDNYKLHCDMLIDNYNKYINSVRELLNRV